MSPFYGWGSAASRLQSHYKEAFYFLPLSYKEFWFSFGQPRKGERLSQPWSHQLVLNTGSRGLGIQRKNKSALPASY